jgi:hypothetical protein
MRRGLCACKRRTGLTYRKLAHRLDSEPFREICAIPEGTQKLQQCGDIRTIPCAWRDPFLRAAKYTSTQRAQLLGERIAGPHALVSDCLYAIVQSLDRVKSLRARVAIIPTTNITSPYTLPSNRRACSVDPLKSQEIAGPKLSRFLCFHQIFLEIGVRG